MACHLSPEAASAQASLAEFIYVASQCIDESHWFCLRGKCDSSLCIHTMLLLQEYATMMYVAGLLEVGKQGNEFTEESWREFLCSHKLAQHGKLGISKITISKVDVK